MLKRTTYAGITAALLCVGTATVLAEDNNRGSEQTVIQSRTFTIPAGHCSQLPANIAVRGIGLERTTTIVNDDGGRLSYVRISIITGTASDNLGGSYTFAYQNRLKAKAIPGNGTDVDSFALTGTGLADGMSTFFRAKVTLDAGANPVGFQVLERTGDPATCDPL